MDRETVRRFGGRWVKVIRGDGLYSWGWLKCILSDSILLSHRRNGRNDKVEGNAAIRLCDVVYIETIPDPRITN